MKGRKGELGRELDYGRVHKDNLGMQTRGDVYQEYGETLLVLEDLEKIFSRAPRKSSPL